MMRRRYRAVNYPMVRRPTKSFPGFGLGLVDPVDQFAINGGGGSIVPFPIKTWSCIPGYVAQYVNGKPGCVPYGDAPPIVLDDGTTIKLPTSTDSGIPSGQIQVQLPNGQVISATVTQPAAAGATSVDATIQQVKDWLNQQTLIAGWENWKVLGGAAAIVLLFGGKK